VSAKAITAPGAAPPGGAEVGACRHPGDDPIGRGADELDAEQLGEGEHLLPDAVDMSIRSASGRMRPRLAAATIMVMPSLIG
jgi:hypothetical protein